MIYIRDRDLAFNEPTTCHAIRPRFLVQQQQQKRKYTSSHLPQRRERLSWI